MRSKFQSVEQYPPLMLWLELHAARRVGVVQPSESESLMPRIEAWRIASSIVYVILHQDRKSYPDIAQPGGWDLAVPPSTINIKETFDDIEKRLGLEVVAR